MRARKCSASSTGSTAPSPIASPSASALSSCQGCVMGAEFPSATWTGAEPSLRRAGFTRRCAFPDARSAMARRTGDLVRNDLLIVGGGLTGLALGLAVAQAGVPATIVERTPLALNAKPARDGRVLALALSSKRMLEALGLWPALALEAEPILEIRVVDGESPLFLH